MMSTKETSLLLVITIIGVSYFSGEQQLNDRQSYPQEQNPTRLPHNPGYQRSANTASQYGQYSGYQNSVGSKQQNDRQSYPQEQNPTRLPHNPGYQRSANTASQYGQHSGYQNPVGSNSRMIDKIKPFTESPDMRRAYDLMSGQQSSDSKQRNYFGSVTIQKNNSYNVDPNSTNIYGSITRISGPYLSPGEQDFLDRIDKQSFSLGGSEPKTLLTRDGKVANLYGGVTHQTNTAYTSQSQHSTQQSTGSRQTTNTQRPAQESFEAQQLQYLITKVSDLTKEIQRQAAEIKAMQTSLNTIDRFVVDINNQVYELVNNDRAKRN
nr:EP-like protein [Cotesia vestalis bracovirus]